jgi:hypothetical protein
MGTQGSWFVDVPGYGRLPAIHNRYFSFDKKSGAGFYHHPDVDKTRTPQQNAKIPAYLEALRTGRYAVLTDDDFATDEAGLIVGVKRRNYRGVWQYDGFSEENAAPETMSHTLRNLRKVANTM